MVFDYQICDADKCTGCFACMNKCPKGAIKSGIDDEGRTLPVIDKEICIQCKLCVRTCPVNTETELREPQICYAAQRHEKEIRKLSASGGVAAVLSEYVIVRQGCVFGAAVNNEGKVCHVCATTKNEIDKLRGSKYVQSDIGFSYREAEKELQKGKMVLFIGTPCQISGLKHYLGKEYEALFCVDLICHGVPPMQYLKEHYKTVTKVENIDTVLFRDPAVGFLLSLRKNGRLIYSADRFHDTYFHAFFRSLTYRENCYECPYAGRKRCSDLTIGDFWGIDRKSLKKIKSGYISAVLINNDKGKAIFDKVKDQFVFEERQISEAVKGNKQLQTPAQKHKLRKEFIEAYKNLKDFDRAVEKIGLVREMKIENIIGKFEALKSKIAWKINSALR